MTFLQICLPYQDFLLHVTCDALLEGKFHRDICNGNSCKCSLVNHSSDADKELGVKKLLFTAQDCYIEHFFMCWDYDAEV